MMKINKIYQGNAIKVLKQFPKESINTCVTSPPYWGLRSYLPNAVQLKENAPDWVKKELKDRGIEPIENST